MSTACKRAFSPGCVFIPMAHCGAGATTFLTRFGSAEVDGVDGCYLVDKILKEHKGANKDILEEGLKIRNKLSKVRETKRNDRLAQRLAHFGLEICRLKSLGGLWAVRREEGEGGGEEGVDEGRRDGGWQARLPLHLCAACRLEEGQGQGKRKDFRLRIAI